ncbi:hypothetical protein AWH56_018330 [Anaerobacillus isosaccharinicus]|uniref:Uncharacterized protein n=1 Tax=Anaerobacillus isosaccharinicus TaxID=1532552 RepID=A0A1S2LH59_9BACI|nr:hypothetical protein [Anaerobacillus isosaccharinicus]MBA5587137.1 hypothetical protein [Anaerobacillus isosaccharinicus]QOY34666.1 hypothetical protein AWH56_018330 [Anaerobacillus isosaccharinicus]
MTNTDLRVALLLGVLYSIAISSAIYFVGNLMFAEWISYIFFLVISTVPSIAVFTFLNKINTKRGNIGLVLHSLWIGFTVSFMSMLASTILHDTFKERIYWDISSLEGFIWFLSFAIIGSLLFTPISYMFVRVKNRLTA